MIRQSTYEGITMAKSFERIGLFAKQRKENITETLLALIALLKKQQKTIIVENNLAELFPGDDLELAPLAELSTQSDLIIVVGGDGSMLTAVNAALTTGTPVLGVNRGRLGFLTDISPQELDAIIPILEGQYQIEPRFLLQTKLPEYQDTALNDVVLFPGNATQMIEFTISVNNKCVCTQRADGLIIATPTGSTAYALSGGGPIVHPKLDAIVLVPMFPHTLSNRPLVVSAEDNIQIKLADQLASEPKLSCDGKDLINIPAGSIIEITKHTQALELVHPLDYDYYQTLRAKLGWQNK